MLILQTDGTKSFARRLKPLLKLFVDERVEIIDSSKISKDLKLGIELESFDEALIVCCGRLSREDANALHALRDFEATATQTHKAAHATLEGVSPEFLPTIVVVHGEGEKTRSISGAYARHPRVSLKGWVDRLQRRAAVDAVGGLLVKLSSQARYVGIERALTIFEQDLLRQQVWVAQKLSIHPAGMAETVIHAVDALSEDVSRKLPTAAIDESIVADIEALISLSTKNADNALLLERELPSLEEAKRRIDACGREAGRTVEIAKAIGEYRDQSAFRFVRRSRRIAPIEIHLFCAAQVIEDQAALAEFLYEELRKTDRDSRRKHPKYPQANLRIESVRTAAEVIKLQAAMAEHQFAGMRRTVTSYGVAAYRPRQIFRKRRLGVVWVSLSNSARGIWHVANGFFRREVIVAAAVTTVAGVVIAQGPSARVSFADGQTSEEPAKEEPVIAPAPESLVPTRVLEWTGEAPSNMRFVAGGRVLVVSGGATLRAFALDGIAVWKADLENDSVQSLRAASDLKQVFVATSKGQVLVLDALSGERVAAWWPEGEEFVQSRKGKQWSDLKILDVVGGNPTISLQRDGKWLQKTAFESGNGSAISGVPLDVKFLALVGRSSASEVVGLGADGALHGFHSNATRATWSRDVGVSEEMRISSGRLDHCFGPDSFLVSASARAVVFDAETQTVSPIVSSVGATGVACQPWIGGNILLSSGGRLSLVSPASQVPFWSVRFDGFGLEGHRARKGGTSCCDVTLMATSLIDPSSRDYALATSGSDSRIVLWRPKSMALSEAVSAQPSPRPPNADAVSESAPS